MRWGSQAHGGCRSLHPVQVHSAPWPGARTQPFQKNREGVRLRGNENPGLPEGRSQGGSPSTGAEGHAFTSWGCVWSPAHSSKTRASGRQ